MAHTPALSRGGGRRLAGPSHTASLEPSRLPARVHALAGGLTRSLVEARVAAARLRTQSAIDKDSAIPEIAAATFDGSVSVPARILLCKACKSRMQKSNCSPRSDEMT